LPDFRRKMSRRSILLLLTGNPQMVENFDSSTGNGRQRHVGERFPMAHLPRYSHLRVLRERI